MISKEQIALQEGVEYEVKLMLGDIGVNNTLDVSKRHAILIEIQSYPIDPKNVNMEHTIDVYARMNAPGHLNEFIDIKDTFPIMNRDNEADMIYHYVIYDLCYLSHQLLETPSIELKFLSLSGEVKTNFEAKVVEFKNLKIN